MASLVSAEQLFSTGNTWALMGWILLLFLPRWRWTHRLVVSGAWSLALSLAYLVLIATQFRGNEGGFGSLAEVAALFRNPMLLLAGWVHYLAFDLLVGTMELRQGQAEGIPHLLLVPCLILTFLFGPVGLLLYVAIRSARSRKLQGTGP